MLLNLLKVSTVHLRGLAIFGLIYSESSNSIIMKFIPQVLQIENKNEQSFDFTQG